MNTDSNDPFKQPPPAPNKHSMEAAWITAASEFHRSQHQKPKLSLAQWIYPIAAAATIAILCALLLTQPTPPANTNTTKDSTRNNTPLNLAQLYTQGQQLFGNQLYAVTITKHKVVWHLNEEPHSGAVTDQLVTLTLHQKNKPNTYIASRPGSLVNISYQGEDRQIEFLSDESDQIIASGDGIYWDSTMPESPIQHTQLLQISQ